MSEPQRFVAVATGLAFEARLARGDETRVCCGHGQRLSEALRAAAGPGCAGIVSFGIAGGLDPRLGVGAAVIASSVIGADAAYPTDARWAQRLLQAAPGAEHGSLYAADQPVLDPAAKAALHRRSGAAAADMESHVAAAIAAEKKIPFAVLRVVADPANRRVPDAALAGMRDDGTLDALAVLRALMRQPAALAPLMRVARDTSIARKVLADLFHRLGPGFGLLDLG